MVRHLASIAEIVDDFDGAVVFYRDTLGVTVKEESPGYAVFELPGVLHFAVWSRAAAAEATYGDAGATDRIPLGWSLGFEVRLGRRCRDRGGDRSSSEGRTVGPADGSLAVAVGSPL